MSQEDDCSSNVEIEGAEVWLGNEESWGIRARPRSKKRSGHPFTRGFVPMGHPPPRAGGFTLGFVASEAVRWSEKDVVSSSTRQGHLFR